MNLESMIELRAYPHAYGATHYRLA